MIYHKVCHNSYLEHIMLKLKFYYGCMSYAERLITWLHSVSAYFESKYDKELDKI